MKKVIVCLIVGLFLAGNAFALVVTAENDAATLADKILGTGITASNIAYSGANATASGIFTGGLSSGIGIESGIILTTGYATSAALSNTSGSTSGPGTTTSLSFDFTTTGGDVYFDYVFASEEYNEFVNSSYNDKFELFVDGANIAFVPGTSTPVEIDTVNLGVNSAFYNNNAPGPYNLTYDGFTDVFTASLLGLDTGIHTMLFNIYDVGDAGYDSAVFIEEGSFSDEDQNVVPEPSTIILLGGGLIGLVFARRKMKK
jgi:hypothetical protein